MISLVSELTDSKGRHARGWLFYDAECDFCTRIAGWLVAPMDRRRLAVAPLQDPRVGALLGLSREELLHSIRYISADGRYSGADALLAVAREMWWARPLVWLSQIPGVLPAMRAAYRRGAKRYRCHAGVHVDDQMTGSC